MQKVTLFCDVCGKEFTDPYWDAAPSGFRFSFSGPGQNDGDVILPHVCYHCRKGLRMVVDKFIKEATV